MVPHLLLDPMHNADRIKNLAALLRTFNFLQSATTNHAVTALL